MQLRPGSIGGIEDLGPTPTLIRTIVVTQMGLVARGAPKRRSPTASYHTSLFSTADTQHDVGTLWLGHLSIVLPLARRVNVYSDR